MERLKSRLVLPLSLSLPPSLPASLFQSAYRSSCGRERGKVLYKLLTNDSVFSPHGSQKTHFSAQWSKKWQSKGKWYINRKMWSIDIARIFEDEKNKNEGGMR
jgi:hypothetical protein